MLRDDIEVVWMFKLEGRLFIVAWASKKLCYLLMLHDDMGVGVMWQEKLGQGNTPPSPSYSLPSMSEFALGTILLHSA